MTVLFKTHRCLFPKRQRTAAPFFASLALQHPTSASTTSPPGSRAHRCFCLTSLAHRTCSLPPVFCQSSVHYPELQTIWVPKKFLFGRFFPLQHKPGSHFPPFQLQRYSVLKLKPELCMQPGRSPLNTFSILSLK